MLICCSTTIYKLRKVWPHITREVMHVSGACSKRTLARLRGAAVGNGCSATHTVRDSVAFPGYQAGNWTTPPGPPAPLMAGFTPINSAPVVPSSGGFYGYQGSTSNNKGAPPSSGSSSSPSSSGSSSSSPSSYSPSPSNTAGK